MQWVVTRTYVGVVDDPSLMDTWEDGLAEADGTVSYIPDRGAIAVTVHVEAANAVAAIEVFDPGLGELEASGIEVLSEAEYERRADMPTIPELMSAAEIAEELGVTRQRVHQLRKTIAFPAPLADLRGGAVWGERAVRKFGQEWSRRPGRPKGGDVGMPVGRVSCWRSTPIRFCRFPPLRMSVDRNERSRWWCRGGTRMSPPNVRPLQSALLCRLITNDVPLATASSGCTN